MSAMGFVLTLLKGTKLVKGKKEEASELEYLSWFKIHADFGPADDDVHYIMDQQFEKETGKLVPKDWKRE